MPSPKDNGEIELVVEGPWLHTILFEIPLLAIVNEVYFRRTQPFPDVAEGRQRLAAARSQLITGDEQLVDCKIADYGTRRRFSRAWQEGAARDRAADARCRSSPAPATPGSR